MKFKRKLLAGFTAASLIVGMAGVAGADEFHQVDGSTTLNGRDLSYGATAGPSTAACTDRGTAHAGIGEIKKNGDAPQFVNNARLSITGTAAQAGITVAGATIDLPNNWRDSGNRSESFTFSTTVLASVPNGTYPVQLKATDGTSEITTSYDVTVDCSSGTDTQKPLITVPANISQTATSVTGNTVTFSVSATDNVGVASVTCKIGADTLTPTNTPGTSTSETYNYSLASFLGTKTVSCQAADAAGNKSDSNTTLVGDQPATFNIAVLFGFDGFFAPIDGNMRNSMKSGSTAPMKFTIANGITSTSIVKSTSGTRHTCDAGTSEDTLEETATGNTSLRHDGTQFIYNWQSPKGQANACYRVTLDFTDGTSQYADFRLK